MGDSLADRFEQARSLRHLSGAKSTLRTHGQTGTQRVFVSVPAAARQRAGGSSSACRAALPQRGGRAPDRWRSRFGRVRAQRGRMPCLQRAPLPARPRRPELFGYRHVNRLHGPPRPGRPGRPGARIQRPAVAAGVPEPATGALFAAGPILSRTAHRRRPPAAGQHDSHCCFAMIATARNPVHHRGLNRQASSHAARIFPAR